MSYAVKTIYHTLQGEGAQTGRAAVFLRFSGCNLWSGREADRAGAICRFCDTDFFGTDGPAGGSYPNAATLAAKVAEIRSAHSNGSAQPWVVCTGGEPLLQLDAPLVDALHHEGFLIAVETNGTRLPPPGVDWLCVSPKMGADLLIRSGEELKLVFPQEGLDPARFESLAFTHFFLQPMAGPRLEENTRLAAHYCLRHPRWRLGLQVHKILGLP